MLGSSLTQPVAGLVGHVRCWPVASQQRSRRNAMLASTACAQRRAEREEVDDFFADRAGQDRPATEPGRIAHG